LKARRRISNSRLTVAGVPDGVVSRRRDARGETTQQRERVHLDRDGPVGEGPFEEDADQAVLALLDLVLSNRRAKHVAQQRLAAGGV